MIGHKLKWKVFGLSIVLVLVTIYVANQSIVKQDKVHSINIIFSQSVNSLDITQKQEAHHNFTSGSIKRLCADTTCKAGKYKIVVLKRYD